MTTPFHPVVHLERHGPTRVHPHVKFLMEKDAKEACPQRTPEWYHKRRHHLTASSIASAVGENPYEQRRTAIKKKVGLEQGFQGNAATEHGNKYEDVAIELYEKRTGEKVISFGLLESIKGPETHFLAGSPDGITASGRLIEVKCPYRRKPNGVIPKHYVHQVQTLMHILDLEVCDFIEYVPESTWVREVFSVVTVKRCPVYWNTFFPKLVSFWEDVTELRREIEERGVETVAEEVERFERELKEAEAAEKAKRQRRIRGCMIDHSEESMERQQSQNSGHRALPFALIEAVADKITSS